MEKMKINGDRMVEVMTIFDQKVQIDVGRIANKSHSRAWEEKDFTKNCSTCPKYIAKTAAVSIIEMVTENNKDNGWIPPLKDLISGICIFGKEPKVLTPTEIIKKCRYYDKK